MGRELLPGAGHVEGWLVKEPSYGGIWKRGCSGVYMEP